MKSEQELRKQLAEVAAAIANMETQIIAARNQEYALKWALGEVEEPQVVETEELQQPVELDLEGAVNGNSGHGTV